MQHSNPQTFAQWEWKSNQDPFSQSEKDQWRPYKPLENDLLEKAFSEDQKKVELEDYIVSIKDMLQRRKDNIFRQRPIRRNTESIKRQEDLMDDQEEDLRTKRFYGAETPKTYNKAFGNLFDFLKFFQNRDPNISEFALLLNDVEASNDLDCLNNTLRPSLIKCLENESNKLPIKTNYQQECEKELLLLFRRDATSFEQFYANVLKAYTMGGFLYFNLNHYLRNEEWSQLESLLPYAYCLCKAFLRSEFIASSRISSSILVYRGAQFDEAALSLYDPRELKFFSWNGLTSTSRNRKIAERFMSKKPPPNKAPVIFTIEVPQSLENTTNWIDIQPYSAFPKEAEVVFPPGSTFELIEVSENSQKVKEIRLKLIINVEELAYQGQIMHGALHSVMMENTRLKLVCLEGKELSDAIVHLRGNQLVEEMEFCLCKFDKKVGADLEQTLEKIQNLKRLTFISPSFNDQQTSWSVILKHVPKEYSGELEIHDIVNSHQLSLLSSEIGSLRSLTSLTLNFSGSGEIADEGLKNLCLQGIQHLNSLALLSLDFSDCYKITDKGLDDLSFQGLTYLPLLTSLTLNFHNCTKITERGMNHLVSQGLKHFTSINSLNLNFSGVCQNFLHKKFENLCFRGMKHLNSLASLSLNFGDINDKDLENLSFQGLKNLTSLTLTLHIFDASKITREGVKSLCSQGIRHLSSLNSFSLNLGYCDTISNECLNDLGSYGLKYLTSLTTLSLRFAETKLSNEALNYLSSQGLKYLSSLKSLNLDFGGCSSIGNKGLNYLSSEGLRYLTLLTSLTLNFRFCYNITDEGLEHLSLQGLWHLPSLNSLTLNFADCGDLTDKGLKALCFEVIKNPNLLGSLSLDFRECPKITSETSQDLQKLLNSTISKVTFDYQEVESTIFLRKSKNLLGKEASTITLNTEEKIQDFTENILTVKGQKALSTCPSITMLGRGFVQKEKIPLFMTEALQCITSLSSLTLDLSGCFKTTDEDLKSLGCQGLGHLTSLTTLTLDLTYCTRFTDQGLKNLYIQGIKNLTSLTLRFRSCSQITDEGWIHLSSQGLKDLTSLTALTLDLTDCNKNSDKVLANLKFKHLINLTSLTLNFSHCYKFTDEGLSNLSSQQLRHLTFLTLFALNIQDCRITEEGLYSFYSQGLKHLTLLKSLTLELRNEFQITDKSLNDLSSHGLKHLTSLTSLVLSLTCCKDVTDRGIDYLTQGFKFLTSLKSLTLEVQGCDQITEKGLYDLSAQGLKHLTSLTALSLDFLFCPQITDQGLCHLSSQGLKYLTLLSSFSLNCKNCKQITDEGLSHLSSQGLKYLTSLTSLSLNFSNCDKLTEEGLNNLCSQGIKSLVSLASLTLDLNNCDKIKTVAWKNLHRVLKYFGYDISQSPTLPHMLE